MSTPPKNAKRCETCNNIVRQEASVCRHCGFSFGPQRKVRRRPPARARTPVAPYTGVDKWILGIVLVVGAATVIGQNEAAKTPDPEIQRLREERSDRREAFNGCISRRFLTAAECAEQYPLTAP